MSSKNFLKMKKPQPMTGKNLREFHSENDDKSGKPMSQDEIHLQPIISPKLQFGLTVFVIGIQLVMIAARVIASDQGHVDNSFRKFESLCEANELDLSVCFKKLLKVDFVAKVEKLTELAEDANSKARESLSAAEEAKKIAKDVKSALETVTSNVAIADKKAGAANESADKALTTSEEAKSEASKAMKMASEARMTANSVDAKAENANRTADTALNTAKAAESVALAAQSKAENALSKAKKAQETADTALKKADTALDYAKEAQDRADAALDKADTALTKAEKAQETANTALNKSEKAQETADTALNKTEKAQETATTALNKAEKAQETADTALKTAESAQNTTNNNKEELDHQNQTSQTRYDEFRKYKSDMELKQERSHFKMSLSEELIDQLRNKEIFYDAGLYLSLFSIFCVVMLILLVVRKGNVQHDRTAHAVRGGSVPRPIDQEDKYNLKWRRPMENSVCVVAFHSETERQHTLETQSVFESVGKSVPRIHSRVVRQHADIQNLPGSKVFFVFVDFNERNVILEDPAKGLGNLRVTTVRSLWKFGADVTVIYCKDQGSRKLDADLFNRDLTSIFSHPELSTLKNQDRMLSIFDEFTDKQKEHCREIINQHLKRA